MPRWHRPPTRFCFPVGHSFLRSSPLSDCHRSPGYPHRTSHVPPRYTPPGPVPGAPAPPPPRSGCSWSGIERMPYAIQNSEFGILKSDFGNRPNRRPAPLDFRKQAIQPLSAPHPLSPYSPTIKRAPRPLPAPAIHIHTQSAGFPFHVVEWRWLKTSIGGGTRAEKRTSDFAIGSALTCGCPPIASKRY